ncbi:ABC transporter substrate-binding protein [Peristeroidobacter soli]|uniref:ABC transporter substrate-binding protein n=1 Tax=Peristeroidobacter soli TaxID=2497877 RepID=UPI001300A225|nr:ABC transporter substrate-binding protein [Peristeroidobacter soli]
MQDEEPQTVRAALQRVLTLGLGMAVLASAAAHADAKKLTDIVIGLPSSASLNYSMFTAAMELGYFEQEGLSVRLQELQGGAVVMSQVVTKSIPIGTGTADPLMIANQPGRSRLPLKFFYNQTREYNWEFVVPESSPIRAIADLKGRRIGVGALTNSHMPVSRMILKDSGLQLNRDYRFIAIGSAGPAFSALLNGQVDAYITFTTNIARFESSPEGRQLRSLPIGDRFKGLFQNGFFAHEDVIKNTPQLLIGFGRASAKATIFCQQAMEFCLQSYWRHFPNLKPRDSDAQSEHRLVESLKAPWNAYFAFPQGQVRRFGEYPQAGWQALMEILFAGGEIASKYDPATLYTNELVARINDFDAAAIEKQALSYRK